MLERAEGWKNRHGAKFETTKYILIHFTRNKHRKTDSPVTIANVIIQPSREARYLGVIFDKNLTLQTTSSICCKERNKVCTSYLQNYQSNMGSRLSTPTTTIHCRRRTKNGLRCLYMAPTDSIWTTSPLNTAF